MHCLDCRERATTSTAVGVCHDCGAAVCETHARVDARPVRRGTVLGAPDEAVARTVRCPKCAEARAA
ncbi:DUF2180 family protein [Streptomyces sp. BA2]|uniref:DUF2180 family protein n=1 Tax=Streptomyces sp. BA2 TaxID=436595 RepID=UPI001322F898|nr:DUF2180 family protein [Streptomyces sp. BA2]MWA14603.1 DUF2180 family protein [Streptomyces sp. BA2]